MDHAQKFSCQRRYRDSRAVTSLMTGFGDLAFLLLPSLPGVAEKAWTPFRTTWAGHRGRLAGHETLWEALGFVNHFRPVATVRNH